MIFASGKRHNQSVILLRIFIITLIASSLDSVGAFASTSPASESVEVSITFDDLPATGASVEGFSKFNIVKETIQTLKAAGIRGVYGFANGAGVKDSTELKTILKLWRQSGHFIGNHTFAHSDLGTESAEAFIQDIQENETLYEAMVPSKEFRVFRFPFLQEGDSLEKRMKVREYLFKKQYKIAQVSLDFEDWAWNFPYARCVKKKDGKSLAWLKESFLNQALKRLDFMKALSQRLHQRQIKFILLLHIGGVDAAFLKDLIKTYQNAGVKFISLATAMKDPVYQQDPKFVGPAGKTFLIQQAEARQWVTPDKFPAPKKELEALCLD